MPAATSSKSIAEASADGKPITGMRLRRMILLETLLVALAGFMVWGIAWEFGFPAVGLGSAIVIWLAVSPIIEIATVMKYRRLENGER